MKSQRFSEGARGKQALFSAHPHTHTDNGDISHKRTITTIFTTEETVETQSVSQLN